MVLMVLALLVRKILSTTSLLTCRSPSAGIFTDATKTTPVTVGVDSEGDAFLFEPPIAGTFSYQCVNHANMGGTITIS